ncbi:MAG TPA: hypothetical protein VIM75_24670 [Ohtaekwangia sp.]|uniref:hypothetical protein n=1 Tax=Ohtaekwangia sp. TaxID=2066019 RepID=UPI002F92B5BE
MKQQARYRVIFFRLIVTLVIVIIGWTALTLWVERKGPARYWHFSGSNSTMKVLVVFDPDPIYNLDEQVCLSIAKGIAGNRIDATVATVRRAEEMDASGFDGFVLCANTYNWAPDWSITQFAKSTTVMKHRPVMAITLGSGSTQRSQRVFHELLSQQGYALIGSRTLWLMRPNDEARMKESNIDVAKSIAYRTGIQLADSIRKFYNQ